jgi:excisionase family DNA binding protein
MNAIEEQYLTVAEAARLLRVAPSTIRRWIREGDLPAYRMGKRRLALRRTDVDTMIAPTRLDAAHGHYEIYTDASQGPETTPERVQEGLAALERLKQHRAEIAARRGDKPLRPVLEIIHEMREERMRELG